MALSRGHDFPQLWLPPNLLLQATLGCYREQVRLRQTPELMHAASL